LVQSLPWRKNTRAVAVAAADKAEAVVLDLVGPTRAGWNRAAHHWQTGLDEAGQ
jgi:hypothetical protein